MIVCIAEKPSVAKEIAAVLGATRRRDGYFEGNGYQVTWAYGHLFHIKEPEKMNKAWEKWRLDYLPMLPEEYAIELNNDKGSISQYKVIRQLYQKADKIINCGDAGQEGELIQRRIMQYAGVKCPVERLWISSLTEEAIKDGFRHLQPQGNFDNLNEAGEARADGDWLLGMNCTRLYSCKYGRPGHPLSVGRVQTPTLAMVVGRDFEIENFKSTPYWELQTTYRGVLFRRFGAFNTNGKTWSVEDSRFRDENEARHHLAVAREHDLIINTIEKVRKQELPPQLYDLTSLQVDCNKRFGFSAEETLKTMQSLYEKKVATYPRVDTRYLTHDIYGQCPKILSRLKNYSTAIAPLMGKTLPRSSRVFDDKKVTDHHAIIPTGESSSSLSKEESLVYDLICTRFIAVFYPPCQYSQTTVLAYAGTEAFKATGRHVTDYGWKSLYTNVANDEDEEEEGSEQTLPDFREGEHGVHQAGLVQKMTTPPKRYTEATLLQAMETAGRFVDNDELRDALKENGIGRPSSRAGIIETLYHRGYIVRSRKNVISTQTGRLLVSVIKDKMLVSPEMTGRWEKKLRMIEKGTFTRKQFMEDLVVQLREIVSGVKGDATNNKIGVAAAVNEIRRTKSDKRAMTESRYKLPCEKLVGKTCPVCGIGIIRKGPYSYYCTEYKNGCKYQRPLN